MYLMDGEIQALIESNITVKINGQEFYIRKNPKGSCDNCYFYDKKCASKAVTICCSNGGNILELRK